LGLQRKWERPAGQGEGGSVGLLPLAGPVQKEGEGSAGPVWLTIGPRGQEKRMAHELGQLGKAGRAGELGRLCCLGWLVMCLSQIGFPIF